MNAGALVRTARRERGMSQAALARAAGTSQPAIARLEAGHLSPSISTLERILRALGLRMEVVTSEIDAGIDRTLIAQNLRLSPAERLRKLKQEYRAIARMGEALARTGRTSRP